jgi:hypothetical protein
MIEHFWCYRCEVGQATTPPAHCWMCGRFMRKSLESQILANQGDGEGLQVTGWGLQVTHDDRGGLE